MKRVIIAPKIGWYGKGASEGYWAKGQGCAAGHGNKKGSPTGSLHFDSQCFKEIALRIAPIVPTHSLINHPALDSSVFLPTSFGVIFCDGLAFAVAFPGDLIGTYTFGYQCIENGLGALFG